MTHRYADIVFTAAVQAAQERYGARHDNERLQQRAGPNDALGERETEFIAQCDSFYLGTVSASGWPYVQHRGGPPGFLQVLDGRRLAFADFRGNRQYVSLGNLDGNDRVSLFLMNYPRRLRLKLLGRLRMSDVGDADPELVEQLRPYPYRASMERIAEIALEAYDWNCNQHIMRRFSEAHVQQIVAPLQARIASLEAELQIERARRRRD